MTSVPCSRSSWESIVRSTPRARLSRWMHEWGAACAVLMVLSICSALFVRASPSSENGQTFELKGNAVVIDAGSTGTRLYVYSYTYSSAGAAAAHEARRLLVEMPPVATKRVSPGIAAFAEQVLMQATNEKPAGGLGETALEEGRSAPSENAVSGEQFHSDSLPCSSFSEYMQRLRQAAVEALRNPADQREALLVFRGTAGMRALPEEQGNALLNAVCSHLKIWGMKFVEGKSCGVLDGQEEGVLGWLALNQLLGRMPEDLSMVRFKQQLQQHFQSGGSGAMIEMGGASAQVVFELPLSALDPLNLSAPAVHTTQPNGGSLMLPVKGHPDLKVLRIRDQPILLFTKSYMGLGRQLALVRVAARSLREHYDLHASHLEEKLSPSPSAGVVWGGDVAASVLPSSPQYEAPLPCFPRDLRLFIDLHGTHFVIDEFLHDDSEASGSASPVLASKRQKCILDEGAEDSRRARSWTSLTSHLDQQAIRELAKEEAERLRTKRHTRARGIASFEGCQKDISSSWEDHEKLPVPLPKDMRLYATENFFHFNEYVVQAETRPRFSASSFRKSAQDLCGLPRINDVVARIHPSAAAEKAQTGCFGLVLMSQFLEDVLGLDEERELLAVNEVNGIEVSWTAGILFVLLPEMLEAEQPREAVFPIHDEL
ncbi:hypothetical protein Esti_002438 [Eimeria stiedai]